MITNFKIFEENLDETEFKINDLVKYKLSNDDIIYQIYRIHEDKSRRGYQTGYMRDINTKKSKWEI